MEEIKVARRIKYRTHLQNRVDFHPHSYLHRINNSSRDDNKLLRVYLTGGPRFSNAIPLNLKINNDSKYCLLAVPFIDTGSGRLWRKFDSVNDWPISNSRTYKQVFQDKFSYSYNLLNKISLNLNILVGTGIIIDLKTEEVLLALVRERGDVMAKEYCKFCFGREATNCEQYYKASHVKVLVSSKFRKSYNNFYKMAKTHIIEPFEESGSQIISMPSINNDLFIDCTMPEDTPITTLMNLSHEIITKIKEQESYYEQQEPESRERVGTRGSFRYFAETGFTTF